MRPGLPPTLTGASSSARSSRRAAPRGHASAARGVDLTPREFEILRVLLAHAGRLVTKGRLLRAVWGEAYQGEDSYVYVHVSQLRRKLAAADPTGALRDLIVTEPGVGYRIRRPRGPEASEGAIQGLGDALGAGLLLAAGARRARD